MKIDSEEVKQLILSGLDNREIAKKLDLTIYQLRNFMKSQGITRDNLFKQTSLTKRTKYWSNNYNNYNISNLEDSDYFKIYGSTSIDELLED